MLTVILKLIKDRIGRAHFILTIKWRKRRTDLFDETNEVNFEVVLDLKKNKSRELGNDSIHISAKLYYFKEI